jgi:hypothetical protein
MSQRLARKLGVPLVGSFNDWFDYNAIIHPRLHDRVERVFRQFFRDCDLALCTCEGMREALGPHPNAHILYPLGSRLEESPFAFKPRPGAEVQFRVAFAGNLGEWYGKMLEALVCRAREQNLPVEFRIFGSNASWSPEFDAWARANNVYRGHLPFARLAGEMEQVDGLLLLMGFAPACAMIERTSFKTKFLDYLSFQKPILLWGPDYCSAVRIAREFDAADICISTESDKFLSMILELQSHPARQESLVRNAGRMYQDRFHPDCIHAVLVEQCRRLVKTPANERAP